MDAKQRLETGDWTKIWMATFNECSKYIVVPTQKQYKIMLGVLKAAFPHLQDIMQTRADSKFVMKKQLRAFFKNTRQRHPIFSKLPQVREMKETYGRTKNSQAGPKNLWGCPTFDLSTPPDGEDERTLELYTIKLRKEFEAFPTNRNRETIELAMEKTKYDRRRMVKTAVPIATILEKYPILGEGVEVSNS